eukprot:GILK01000813.1.p1 GENE.GILK01000813.1~~GILK01000813.1.p1  ORF type:complete len:305 (-),score=45.63 GILK01000813.1:513-1427(-)
MLNSESKKKKEEKMEPTRSNAFVNDGSFMASFLKKTATEKDAPNRLISDATALTASPNTLLSATSSNAVSVPSVSTLSPPKSSTPTISADTSSSPPKERKFAEVAPEKKDRKRRNRWDEEGPKTEQPADPTAEFLSSVKHLKAYDPRSSKDTFEDAIAAGGVIEGGTWEHRKRAMEMALTAQRDALLASASVDGDVSIQASLVQPPQSTMIAPDNKGFQMLQKAGWSAGQGVGAKGTGITAPIMAVAAPNTAGLGHKQAHELTGEEDAFESFRKRRMTEYRSRPNPFNNPRRSYDGYSTGFNGV